MAYLMAKSHGLTEQANTLEQTLIDSDEYDHEKIIAQAEKYSQKSKTLIPLRPIFN